MRRIKTAFLFFLLFFSAGPASAAVELSFYTKELGTSFPHAFVLLKGTVDRTGESVDEDYGFSAKAISPAVLLGRVAGMIITNHSPGYVQKSDRHFTLSLSDDEYDRVMRVIERWRSLPQPSYDLDTRNCVHFVADIAAVLGMEAIVRKGFTKKPRSFVETLVRANMIWLQSRGVIFRK